MQVRSYISCFVVRPAGGSHEFLQLRRVPEKYMGGTWQLVSGGIEEGETAWQAALRELKEEASLVPNEFYQLDVVNTFYLAAADSIMHAPMFCALVDPDAAVQINAEHTDWRWVPRDEMESKVMWPGERVGLAELCREILDNGPAKQYLKIPLT